VWRNICPIPVFEVWKEDLPCGLAQVVSGLRKSTFWHEVTLVVTNNFFRRRFRFFWLRLRRVEPLTTFYLTILIEKYYHDQFIWFLCLCACLVIWGSVSQQVGRDPPMGRRDSFLGRQNLCYGNMLVLYMGRTN